MSHKHDFLKFWNSPEGIKAREETMESLVKEMREKEKKSNEYFESEEFFKIKSILDKALETCDGIDEENLAYKTQQFEGLTRENFAYFCQCIFDRFEKFPVNDYMYYAEYKDLVIGLVTGQGSWFSCYKKEEKYNGF